MTQITADDVRLFLLRHFSSKLAANGVDPASVGDGFDFLQAGLVDSLGVIEMISAVEQHFAITVDFEALSPEQITVNGPFCRFVAGNLARKQDGA